MATYKQPQAAPKVDIKSTGYEGGDRGKTADMPVSVGSYRSKDYEGVKTSGIKIRGTGAATKGLYARGPLA